MTTTEQLSAACDALGKVMGAMEARRMIADSGYKMSSPLFDLIMSRALTDHEIEGVVTDAFRAAALALDSAELEAASSSCNQTESP